MPQLSTTSIFMIYMWTWLVLFLIMQKTKTLLIKNTPTTSLYFKPKKPTPTLPWT
uniref:ATP synthase F0 subunit 8 n=1 Tax=Laticauda semifasciata TaxID=8631 RepID=A0A343JZI7_LATSE|nr:ATP synthase F0 subunit 8 [Laticauda semifasciata]ASZ83538.1 ATP synthase F0 subunit 8 [Laticauda semifasciata]